MTYFAGTTLALLLAATSTAAARPTKLAPCDAAGAGIEYIVPGDAHRRVVFGGKVTLYHLDRQEPVSVRHGVALVYDRGDDRGGLTCKLVGPSSSGFFRVDLAGARETPPDATGAVTATIPVVHYAPDGAHTAGTITLVLAMAGGAPSITAHVR